MAEKAAFDGEDPTPSGRCGKGVNVCPLRWSLRVFSSVRSSDFFKLLEMGGEGVSDS